MRQISTIWLLNGKKTDGGLIKSTNQIHSNKLEFISLPLWNQIQFGLIWFSWLMPPFSLIDVFIPFSLSFKHQLTVIIMNCLRLHSNSGLIHEFHLFSFPVMKIKFNSECKQTGMELKTAAMQSIYTLVFLINYASAFAQST